jgi:hypothetical protein
MCPDGHLDEEVPHDIIGTFWKHKIAYEPITDRDGITRIGTHTKPDLVLADLLSPNRAVVLIIDFTIISERMYSEAWNEKVRRYSPLVQAILDWLGEGDHRVEIVPIVIGRSGVPPPEWSKVCAMMKIATTPQTLWMKIQTCVMENNMKMFGTWQSCNGLR